MSTARALDALDGTASARDLGAVGG
jgi:hypothetical protein